MSRRGPSTSDLAGALLVWAESVVERGSQAGAGLKPACPRDERFWEAVAGSLRADAMASLLDHAADCAPCMMALRVSRELHASSSPSSEFGTGDRSRVPASSPILDRLVSRRSPWAWAALAAAAALASAFVLIPWVGRERARAPDPVFRQGEEVVVRSLLPAGVPLARAEPVLRWSAGPRDSLYRVEVTDAEMRLVAAADALEASQYRLPPDALERLPAGSWVYWRVTAVLRDGTERPSGTFTTRIE